MKIIAVLDNGKSFWRRCRFILPVAFVLLLNLLCVIHAHIRK